MTKIGTARHGTVSINVTNGGIPALRLVKWHAPHQKIECTDEAGAAVMVPLSEINLDHDLLSSLNAPTVAALAR